MLGFRDRFLLPGRLQWSFPVCVHLWKPCVCVYVRARRGIHICGFHFPKIKLLKGLACLPLLEEVLAPRFSPTLGSLKNRNRQPHRDIPGLCVPHRDLLAFGPGYSPRGPRPAPQGHLGGNVQYRLLVPHWVHLGILTRRPGPGCTCPASKPRMLSPFPPAPPPPNNLPAEMH